MRRVNPWPGGAETGVVGSASTIGAGSGAASRATLPDTSATCFDGPSNLLPMVAIKVVVRLMPGTVEPDSEKAT